MRPIRLRLRLRIVHHPRAAKLIPAGLLLLALAVAAPCDARQRPVPPEAACPECRVQLEGLMILHSREDSHALVPMVQGLALDARERVWMSFGPEGPVHVFGVDGRLEGTLGRRGQGPGEFMAPMGVVAFADSVAVFDVGSGRVSIHDMDLGLVRTVRFPGQVFRGVSGEGSVVIVNGIIPTPGSVGHPFHALDLATGNVLRSFGGGPGTGIGPGDPQLHVAFLDRDPVSGDVWTALRHRPLLQRWSVTGELLETLEPGRPWFTGGGRAALGSPSTPPDPSVAGLFHDGRYLWVSLQVAHPEWQRAWAGPPTTESPHPGPQRLPDRGSLFTGRLLVLDGDAGRVVGSWETDLLPSLAATPRGALARILDPGGFYPALEILRPVLRGPSD